MIDPHAADIIRLVELLEGDAPVEWDVVETLLAPFPGWQMLVQTMRDQNYGNFNYIVPIRPPSLPSETAPTEVQSLLLEIFRPYALLVDDRYSPAERLARLQAAEVNLEELYRQCLYNESEVVRAAAEAVQEVDQQRQSLLRGSSQHAVSTEDLLHSVAAPADSAEDLLHLTPAPDSDAVATRQSWLQKLFRGRSVQSG